MSLKTKPIMHQQKATVLTVMKTRTLPMKISKRMNFKTDKKIKKKPKITTMKRKTQVKMYLWIILCNSEFRMISSQIETKKLKTFKDVVLIKGSLK